MNIHQVYLLSYKMIIVWNYLATYEYIDDKLIQNNITYSTIPLFLDFKNQSQHPKNAMIMCLI